MNSLTMSTKRRNCSGPSRESLPVDLLLEIVARADVTTLVRCAAIGRILRLSILEPAFRRRLALQYAAGGNGFDPALLLGVSFLRRTVFSVFHTSRVIHTPSPTKHRVRLDTGRLWKQFKPVASRDGLLLFHRKKAVYLSDHEAPDYELRVCNTFTGHITSLPPTTVADVYPHVFLSVSDGDAGASYELLVADMDMRFQTFSSKIGQWGDVRKASVPEHPLSLPEHPLSRSASSLPAVVIGRTVYWLCPLNGLEDWDDRILALDVDAEAATTMDLPAGCFSRMMAFKKDKHLLLASVHGRLSLLVAERGGISMWTLAPTESTATWSRKLVFGREEIEKAVGLVSSHLQFVLEGFGERSGAVIVRADSSALLRLDLGTKVVTRLHNPGHASVSCLFLHETDLVSLLQTMKSF
ncbi:hypothetical protein ACQ4PT_004781 [Festuca glaucescens]